MNCFQLLTLLVTIGNKHLTMKLWSSISICIKLNYPQRTFLELYFFRCVIAVKPKCYIASKSGSVCKEIFAKRGFGGFDPFGVVRVFVDPTFFFGKGHLIDDSNEYKFMHVPSSISIKKKKKEREREKTFSTNAGFLIFSRESLLT